MPFLELTEVQQRLIIPMMTEKNGVVVKAKTGTGKTMAFVIPTLQLVLEHQADRGADPDMTQALVIAPTRDLALQIKEEYQRVIAGLGLRERISVGACIGGTKRGFGFGKPRVPQIIVATPGRLEDEMLDRRFLRSFAELKYRVYDEADRLLQQGFEELLVNIDTMLKQAHNQSRRPDVRMKLVLFSATTDQTVTDFAQRVIGPDYKFINCVKEDEAPVQELIHQRLVGTESLKETHEAALAHLLENLAKPDYKAILFVPTVASTDYLHDWITRLVQNNIDAKTLKKHRTQVRKIHGKISQYQRNKATLAFKECSSGLLVATDVAARGMDFKSVSEVLQLYPLMQLEDYVHKIGRTGRAGQAGKAILFAPQSYSRYLSVLKRELGINFKEIDQYTPDPDVDLSLDLPAAQATEYVTSLIGYYPPCIKLYGLHEDDSLAGVRELFQYLSGNKSALIPVSKPFATKIGLKSLLRHFEGRVHRGGSDNFGKSGFPGKTGFSGKSSFKSSRKQNNDNPDRSRYSKRF